MPDEDFELEETNDELKALQARVDAAERQRQEMEASLKEHQQQNARLTEYVTAQLQQQYGGGQVAPAPAPAPVKAPASVDIPDKDEDPDAYIEYMIQQKVQAALEQSVKPLQETYNMDRQIMLGTAERSAKGSVAQRFQDFGGLENDVNEYMKQVDPSMRANPQIWEQAYFLVKGRKAVQAEQEAATRTVAADGGQGRPSAVATSAESSAPSSLSPTAERLVKAERMTPGDWEAYGEITSLDDYLAHKAKKEKRGKR